MKVVYARTSDVMPGTEEVDPNSQQWFDEVMLRGQRSHTDLCIYLQTLGEYGGEMKIFRLPPNNDYLVSVC